MDIPRDEFRASTIFHIHGLFAVTGGPTVVVGISPIEGRARGGREGRESEGRPEVPRSLHKFLKLSMNCKIHAQPAVK